MKTAIIITGHMRSFERCLPTQHWHVFRHFPDADFFVSTIADADARKAELLRQKYPGARVEVDAVIEQPDCVKEQRDAGVPLPDTWTRGQPYTHEPAPISVHPQAVLRQLWQLRRGWEVFNGRANVTEYGVIIRCRPDLWFHSFEINPGILPVINSRWNAVFSPWWGKFGGINDRFAVMSPSAANAYFDTYSRIRALWSSGCPIHPESLIAASLAQDGVDVRNLSTEFSTLRATGQFREPEISIADLAHITR